MNQKASLALVIAAMLVAGACQSPDSKTKIQPPSRPRPMNCAKPILSPEAVLAKYPLNAKPGFNSPEEVTAFLEKRWPLSDITKFGIPERRHSDGWQNLVVTD